VPKTTNLTTTDFSTNITNGLRVAYSTAFQKAYKVFFNQKSRVVQTPPTFDQIQLTLANINNTGQSSADNTKNLIRLRYYLTTNNDFIQPEFAADSINLLSKQEMAQILGQEVDDNGYIENMPRSAVVDDKKLWIIGAVLGPIALIIVVFWIIAFIYYKCINPKRSKLQRMIGSTPTPYDNNSSNITVSFELFKLKKIFLSVVQS
jgi:enamine deaminase RidA (YjgF/YER057c/UK114 family)